ncbi:MAG: nuclear transport factor 2 family protein [Sphingomonadales bacterium]
MAELSFEQLRDEWEIAKLVHRYAQAVDRGDCDAWAACFTRDVELRVSDGAALGYDTIVGIPERQLKRYSRTFHGVLTQTATLLSADTAEGEVYCVARHVWTDYHNSPGSMPFSMTHDFVIKYTDRYRKDDGVWRIRRRALTVDFREVSQVELFTGTVPV